MVTSYRSGLECLGDIYRKEGFISLWRGNAANVLRFPDYEVSAQKAIGISPTKP